MDPIITTSKFFTFVTKTGPNLPTYRRKSEIYNGTIIFEIDIMKKSIYNLHFCHCQNLNVTSFLVQSAVISATSSVCKQKQTKQPKHF